MVKLMTDDVFNTVEDMDVEVIDGRNGHNAAKRQAILDAVHLHFPELSSYIETWYLSSKNRNLSIKIFQDHMPDFQISHSYLFPQQQAKTPLQVTIFLEPSSHSIL